MRLVVQSNAGWQGGRPRLIAAYPEDVIHHGCAHTQGRPVAAVVNARWGGHRPSTQEFNAVIHAKLLQRATMGVHRRFSLQGGD